MSKPEEITLLLQQADQGDGSARDKLFALVEKDLRAIAKKRKRAAPASADMDTTMLVHDAFLHLVGSNAADWKPGDRRKFFGFAARKMHDLLIQASRHDGANKRGGEWNRVAEEASLDQLGDAPAVDSGLLIDLQQALAKFEQFALEDAILFRIRFFLGCTFAEVAKILDVSETSAKEAWQRTCAWLQRELKEYRKEQAS